MKTLLPPERNFEQKTDHWNLLYDARDRNTIMTATVIATRRHETLEGLAWELEFDGFPNVRGLVPASETGLPTDKMMNFFVGKEINIRIKGIDKKNNLVACTRRELVEEARNRLLHIAEEGIKFEAQVVFVSDIWLGVDIGGGVIVSFNPREARVSRSMRLDELYSEGQYVQAIIDKIDKSTGQIIVSLIDPWEHVKYIRGDIVTGTVVRLGLGNIFLALSPGVVGIAPYPVNNPTPRLGEKLVCIVNNCNTKEKEISLSVFDPELIRGRRKNRNYWRNKKAEKTSKLTLVQPNPEHKREEK
ncbi:small subunit ribosomal protein S1 [Desulforamulus putei DSM 12395]|uniref:Small subunit ribosomal protein S1 n=1 Tax=Desulforamulus putei DSM 12395 TaxID=1121429 RepID=A0A1M5A8F4_9FIRM|nr:hypothetical protein [Desulforamulus putei]SHF26425.1 small subunit ribosomal protein S1 [Desulforamulus putei DSM 12395]